MLVTALRVELAMAIMLQVPAEGLGGRELRHRRDGDVVEFRHAATSKGSADRPN